MYWLLVKNPLRPLINFIRRRPLWRLSFLVRRHLGADSCALAVLEKGLERHADRPEWHLDAGRLCLRCGQLDRAAWHYRLANCSVDSNSFLSWLEQSCQEDGGAIVGNRIKVLTSLGNWYLEAGEAEKALTCFDQVTLAVGEACSSTLNNKGVALLSLGRTREALDSFMRSCSDCRYPEVQFNIGLALSKLGRFSEALVCYEKAQRLGFTSADLLNNKGFVLYHLSRYSEAAVCYELARPLTRDDVTVLSNLAACYWRLERYHDALHLCQHALRSAPQDINLHNSIALCLEKLDQACEALTHFDQALQIDPSNLVLRANRAACLARLGRVSEALDIYDLLLAEEPSNHYIWGLRGDLLSTLGRNREAVAAYNRSLGLTG